MITHITSLLYGPYLLKKYALPCLAVLIFAPAIGHAQPKLPGSTDASATPDLIQLNQKENITQSTPDLQVTPLSLEETTRQLEAAEGRIQNETREAAFQAALEGLLPLRPAEIRELLEKFDRTQESVEVPVYPNPKPEIAVKTLSLDPGAAPISVKLGYGHVTTINILDASGAPWPIEDISWAGNFEVVESSGGGSHILRVSPQSEFAYGNMSIRLLELQTPVTITLETNRDLVHYRFDAIIPEYGPLANAPLIQQGTTITAGGDDVTTALRGVMPENATRLDVSGADGRTSAYKINDKTYIRTPLTLLSPGWSSSASSADGLHVYVISNVPVLVLSDKGRMVRVRLSEPEDF